MLVFCLCLLVNREQLVFFLRKQKNANTMPQVGDSLTFNVDDGGLEAQVHGCRAKLLRAADYSALGQCTTVDGIC